MTILAQWLFSRETLSSNLSFIDIVALWEGRFRKYIDDALIRNHRYKYVVAIRLMFSICAEYMLVLMLEKVAAA